MKYIEINFILTEKQTWKVGNDSSDHSDPVASSLANELMYLLEVQKMEGNSTVCVVQNSYGAYQCTWIKRDKIASDRLAQTGIGSYNVVIFWMNCSDERLG